MAGYRERAYLMEFQAACIIVFNLWLIIYHLSPDGCYLEKQAIRQLWMWGASFLISACFNIALMKGLFA